MGRKEWVTGVWVILLLSVPIEELYSAGEEAVPACLLAWSRRGKAERQKVGLPFQKVMDVVLVQVKGSLEHQCYGLDI